VFEITHKGQVVILTMSHGKANAMDLEFCEGISAEFARLQQSGAKAVVLTGQGRIFSAGVDLVRALEGGPDYFRQFLPALSKAFEAVFFAPFPVIAAINGHAIAGGCVLACCADRRMMAKDAGRVGVPELAVGVPFPSIAVEIMRFAVSHHHLQEIILSASTYPPEEAKTRGLVDEIAEGDLLSRAIAAAEHFTSIRPEAFALSKRQLRQPVADRYKSEAARFESEVNDLWYAPQAFDRIRDYVSRTLKKA
jgi:enoyl-CoA hydratase